MGKFYIRIEENCSTGHETFLSDNGVSMGTDSYRKIVHISSFRWNFPDRSFCFYCPLNCHTKPNLGLHFRFECCNYHFVYNGHHSLSSMGVWNIRVDWNCGGHWAQCWLCRSFKCCLHTFSVNHKTPENERSLHRNGHEHLKWNSYNFWIWHHAFWWVVYQLLKVCSSHYFDHFAVIFHFYGVFWSCNAHYRPREKCVEGRHPIFWRRRKWT